MFSKKKNGIVSNLEFISQTKFMLSYVEHEKKKKKKKKKKKVIITSGPV